jgi:CarD family transcriptional regulator
MYGVGDYVVKSVDGVCRVDDVSHVDMPGVDKNKLYLLLVPIAEQGKKIYIPADTADQTVRRVMTEEEAWKFIQQIPEIEEIWVDNEKLRERQYKEAVKSCEPQRLVGIIKITYLRKKTRLEQGKKNTVVDERYFKIAENNLYSELGFALNKDKNEISRIIADSINKSNDS